MQQVHVLRSDQGLLGLQGEFTKVLPCETGFFDHLVDRFSLQQFHHHEGTFLVEADIVNGHDVRMLQGRERAGFFCQLPGGFFFQIRAALRQDSFDRHFATQVFIVGAIDGSYATLTNFSTNFVSIIHAACRQYG